MTSAQLDEVLGFYITEAKAINATEISNYFHANGITRNRFYYTRIEKHLLKDGLIERENFHANDKSIITVKGIRFYEKGGYAAFEKRLEEKRRRLAEKEIKEAQQLQSVIDTNAATQTAYRIQRRQGRNTLILVAASTILSLLTLVKEVWLSPPSIDTPTKQLLQKQTTNTDSLQRSLRRIDSTFQVVADSFKK